MHWYNGGVTSINLERVTHYLTYRREDGTLQSVSVYITASEPRWEGEDMLGQAQAFLVLRGQEAAGFLRAVARAAQAGAPEGTKQEERTTLATTTAPPEQVAAKEERIRAHREQVMKRYSRQSTGQEQGDV
jgi:hypothetical protein